MCFWVSSSIFIYVSNYNLLRDLFFVCIITGASQNFIGSDFLIITYIPQCVKWDSHPLNFADILLHGMFKRSTCLNGGKIQSCHLSQNIS